MYSPRYFNLAIICMWMIILSGNNRQFVISFKSLLDTQFKLKNLGTLKYFLGMEVARTTKGTSLCQRIYALVVLDDVGYLGTKPIIFPMDQNLKLSKLDCDLIDNPGMYRRFIG